MDGVKARPSHPVLAALIWLGVVHRPDPRASVRAPGGACAAGTRLLVGPVDGARLRRAQRRPFRVTAVTPERGDAWTVAVEPEGHAGLTFQPGQFAWLTLGRSPYAMQEHPFSFSSSPALGNGRLEFTIKKG